MYEVDEKLLQGILNYLSTKPFAEVYQLVNAIQGCKKIEEKEGDDK